MSVPINLLVGPRFAVIRSKDWLRDWVKEAKPRPTMMTAIKATSEKRRTGVVRLQSRCHTRTDPIDQ